MAGVSCQTSGASLAPAHPPALQFPPPFSPGEVNLTTTKKYVQNPDVPCTEPQRGKKLQAGGILFFLRFASDVRLGRDPRERVCGTSLVRRARAGCECCLQPPPGSLPRALLRSSSFCGFGSSRPIVLSCLCWLLAPRSGLSCQASSGDPRSTLRLGPRGLRGNVWAALRLSPAAPPPAPVPLLELRAASSPAQTPSWVPYARCGLPPCTRCHLFPLPWTRHRRAAAWPAEGPVGPEMWLCQGGERPTGREALQVYPVLKENKTFSWETFPLCFSPPAHFSCSLLLGCLPGSAPCLLSLETPSRSQGCGSESGLPGAQAVQRLARPCMPSLQPLPHPLGQREGQRLAVWLQVRGESRWPVSQLCLCAVQAQPWVRSPGFRHTLGSSAPLCSARSPSCREDGIHRVVFRVLAPILHRHPGSIPLFLHLFSALCTSREVSLAPLKRVTPRGCVAS